VKYIALYIALSSLMCFGSQEKAAQEVLVLNSSPENMLIYYNEPNGFKSHEYVDPQKKTLLKIQIRPSKFPSLVLHWEDKEQSQQIKIELSLADSHIEIAPALGININGKLKYALCHPEKKKKSPSCSSSAEGKD
jgi:hypothetical protein